MSELVRIDSGICIEDPPRVPVAPKDVANGAIEAEDNPTPLNPIPPLAIALDRFSSHTSTI